jgi:excisionase family DNA binding protein
MVERIQSPAVANILGVTTRAVQEMAARGDLPSAARIGRRWTFEESAIRKYVRTKEDECRRISIRGAGRGGVALRLPDAITDEAYERAIGLKRKSA